MSSLVPARIVRKATIRKYFPKARKPSRPPKPDVTCAINKRAKQAQNVQREPKLRKQIIFKEIREILDVNKMVTAFHYNDGITSAEWEELRYILRQKGITMKIVPNKLTQKSLEDTPYVNMQPLFVSSTGIFYSQEPSTVTDMIKILSKFPKIEILGGKFENRLLAKSGILDYAQLPSIDVLRSQFCQLLIQTASRTSSLLGGNQARLSSLLTQHLKEKS
ncbi:39S ribosomal protein L10, mitochondrial [Trichoplax sp. H2]|uniref:Large ribosomal subunit protein uL10m n=1 Tax=Trichoplax adhaerens TaxID=10228 RepID=B3RS31_TRIAD|nr:hypothetical protein TRIADDRAFT_54455 [Trichoplax adhaerens]EDV26447.1 hypothetical protein TRIADDRAFT_54455 [Trichoplax adhaerens]RDD40686.1 39S ribosomal protein L10, mitochondrial [Trichoplax sp. H2]|eukprot:XP_002110443.1 hypothetical protein TRIADDRAFT_54455 [Trichoplax adhaerens]